MTPQDPALHLPPGLEERYQVKRLLGAGAMGRVLLVEDRQVGRDVAMKLLGLSGEADLEFRSRFLREGKILARVESPYVVRLFDSGQAHDQFYMCMEILTGGDLREHLSARPGPRPFAQAVEIFRGIVTGLQACHEVGILHRDLKPANVMLRADLSPVLTDFGLSSVQDATKLTATGMIVGTPYFMSPDHLMGAPCVPSSDLYPAALMFLELLTGKIPLAGPTAQHVLERRMVGPIPGPRDTHPQASPRLDRLIRRMLDPERARRVVSAAEVLEELEAGLAEDPDTAPAGPGLGGDQTQSLRAFPALEVSGAAGSSSSLGASLAVSTGAHPPLGPPRGPGRRVLLLVAFVVAVALGFGLSRPRGGPRPGTEPLAPVLPALGADTAELRAFLADVEVDHAVRTGLDLEETSSEEMLTGTRDTTRAPLVWERANRVFWEDLLLPRKIPALAKRLQGRPLDAATVAAASRLLMIERLLSRSDKGSIRAAYGPGDDSGLPGLLAAWVAVAAEPALDGPTIGGGQLTREQYQARMQRAVEGLGPGWQQTLGEARLFLPELGFMPRVRPRNLADQPFRSPQELLASRQAGGVTGAAFDQLQRPWFRASLAVSPAHIEVDLKGFEGDLELAFSFSRVAWTHQVELEVVGELTSLTVYFPACKGDTSGAAPAGGFAEGRRLRLAAAVLPRGPRRLRVSVRALQPVTHAEPTVNLEAVFQRVP